MSTRVETFVDTKKGPMGHFYTCHDVYRYYILEKEYFFAVVIFCFESHAIPMLLMV